MKVNSEESCITCKDCIISAVGHGMIYKCGKTGNILSTNDIESPCSISKGKSSKSETKKSIQSKTAESKVIELRILSEEDRNNLVLALANNGYKVWIKSPEYPRLFSDYYVCLELKED